MCQVFCRLVIFSFAFLIALPGLSPRADDAVNVSEKGAAPVISYPRADADVNAVFSQETFDMLTSSLMSWQQAPGSWGRLWLHACWGTTSALARRYHGQSTSTSRHMMKGAIELYNVTGNNKWRRMAADIASNVLFLQMDDGGFSHATAEFEPTYVSYDATCPIHQENATIALLYYAEWEHAEPLWKEEIKKAVDFHFRTFNKAFWKRGNGWKHPFDLPAWCGVTNQDLIVIEAMARYGKIYGDFSLYEEYGKPVLDTLLSPLYYHEEAGTFRRGDAANFVERTLYYHVIIPSLKTIHECTGDERIPPIVENVTRHLFDAFFVDDLGFTHLAWGAKTDPKDEAKVIGWITYPVTVAGYPGLLPILNDYVTEHPDPVRENQVRELERTLAAYVFSDGTVPLALHPEKPLFNTVGGTNMWEYLIERLGEDLKDPQPVTLPTIWRTSGPVTFECNETVWRIREEGVQKFAGFKPEPTGIIIGEEGSIAGANFKSLDKPDVIERMADTEASK